MTELNVEVEPGAVGFDAARLARIESHFARYVDDGRLPGWLILVSRGGKIVLPRQAMATGIWKPGRRWSGIPCFASTR